MQGTTIPIGARTASSVLGDLRVLFVLGGGLQDVMIFSMPRNLQETQVSRESRSSDFTYPVTLYTTSAAEAHTLWIHRRLRSPKDTQEPLDRTLSSIYLTRTTPITMEDPSSITLITRTDLSLLYRIMRALIRPLRPRLAGVPSKPYEDGSPKLHPPKSLSVQTQERKADGIYTYKLLVPAASTTTEKQRRTTPKCHIYYFAGGGFQATPSNDHWKLCAAIAKDLAPGGVEFSVVSYPLAPKHTAKDALPMLYKWLEEVVGDAVEGGESVYLMGDSSGGNIVLELAFWWAGEMEKGGGEEGLRRGVLKGVFAMSPAVDMTNENPKIKEVDRLDPLLTSKMTEEVARIWCGEVGRRDPRVSPLFADFGALKRSGLRVDGLIGGYDVLAPDDVRFREKLAEFEIKGEWLQWEGQMHCFPLAFSYPIRECREGKRWIVDVLKRNLIEGMGNV